MSRVGRPSDERGAVAVLVAIVSVLLVICIAFAVDLGYAWQVKRSMVKATDASALAAAREARDQAALRQTLGSGTCTPAAVQSAAQSALSANRPDASMDFCAISNASGAKNGVVTVRATTQAKMSFSRIIGFNSVNVPSSTSALWQQARLLPFAACAVKGNDGAADWVEDPSTPTSAVLQASSADTSTLCSGGKSGAFGVIDLTTAPTSATSFDACRTDDAAIATDLVDWITNGYDGNIPIDAYRCATVGQYYGTLTANVDAAVCRIPQGSIVALPVVTVSPKKKSDANSKQWIVQISGFALTAFDDYTGNNGADLCSQYRASGSSGAAPGARLRTFVPVAAHRADTARRGTVRKYAPHRRALRRTAKAIASLDLKLNNSDGPITATVGTNVVGTIRISNGGDASWTGPVSLTFTSLVPSSVTAPAGCTWASPNLSCPGGTVAPGSSSTISFGATFPTTGNGRLVGSIGSSAAEKDNVDYQIVSAATTTSSSTTTTTTTPAPDKSLVVTVTGSGTGTVTATGKNEPTYTCTAALSPCTFTYPKSADITLTASATSGSFAGWSQACTGTAATCDVKIPSNSFVNVTATFTTSTVSTTTTTVPIGSYRELHLTFQTLLTGSSLTSDDLTVYRICKVNVATVSAATTLTCK